MSDPANPFDFTSGLSNYEPALAAAVKELDAKIKHLDPAAADELVKQVQEATKQKKSANEILSIVTGIIGKGIGLAL